MSDSGEMALVVDGIGRLEGKVDSLSKGLFDPREGVVYRVTLVEERQSVAHAERLRLAESVAEAVKKIDNMSANQTPVVTVIKWAAGIVGAALLLMALQYLSAR
jgi:hypothetical protein